MTMNASGPRRVEFTDGRGEAELRLALVDAEAGQRSVLAFRLKRAGFRVSEFSRKQELLERFSEGPDCQLDVVICAVDLPAEERESQVILEVRRASDPALLVLMAAQSGLEVRRLADWLGASAILRSPVPAGQILDVIRGLAGLGADGRAPRERRSP